ncbi:hypothetical protein [Anaerobacillus alkalidiazotrophicus]|uniref:hypothetical protein n=1 Tax=Anaerobacillus alkalidiazotrophicus TaxID=472963 RepID=UPI00147118E8|nr:hypothetical protein [Anaerobacillus alkalidiazotrophicus]
MKIQIIEGPLSKEARSSAYKYLKELYRKEKRKINDCNLRSSIDRGAGEKRL